MASDKIAYRVHAIQRMFQRRTAEAEVQEVLRSGEAIESYPEDTPYSSRLILDWSGSRPLHVVLAENHIAQERIVITVYEPDREQWTDDFKRRRS